MKLNEFCTMIFRQMTDICIPRDFLTETEVVVIVDGVPFEVSGADVEHDGSKIYIRIWE